MKKLFLRLIFFFPFVLVKAQLPGYVPSNGLIAWWSFSGNALDSSGNGNNGIVNGATLTQDRFGRNNQAYYFSGSSCATRIDATVNTSSIKTGLTISVWILRVGNGCIGPRILEFWPGRDGPGQAQWGWDNSNNTGFGSTTSTGSSAYSAFTPPNNNVWTHLVYSNDGKNGNFYQDGKLINVVSSGGNPTLASSLSIGRMNHPAWDAFNGKIDDLGIWGRALTQCEVQALYNSKSTNSLVTKNFLGEDKKICGNDSVVISASSGMQNYFWSNGEKSKSVNLKESGVYYCTQFDSIGCSYTDTVLISLINGKISPRDTFSCDSNQIEFSLNIPRSNFVKCGLPVSNVDLDGYWPFCGDAKDKSPSGNDGTVNGATLTKDRFGNINSAYSFDGNDYISLKGPFFSGSSKVSAFTYSVWVNLASLNGNMSISCKEGYWRTKVLYINNSGVVSFGGSDPAPQGYFGISSPSNTITTNKWFHIVVTYDSSNLKLFVNNKLITKQSISYSVLDYSYLATGNSTSTNYIGASHPVSPGVTNYFNGVMDDLAIWSRALTLSEITKLYSFENQLSINWSSGDTISTLKYNKTGRNKVWVAVSDGLNTCHDTTTVMISNLKVTIISIDSVNCYQGEDGSIISTVNGGIKPWTFHWDDKMSQNMAVAKDLNRGKYQLIVIDSVNCRDTISGTVNEPAKVTLAITAIDSVNCYQGSDGSITTSISGGSNGYKYQWNDGARQTTSKASNLKKGTYKLIAKDLYGCSDSISGTVNEPAKVTLAITAIDSVNCYQGADGSITTSISGGSNGYKYQWNDGAKQTTSKASNLKKGAYKLIAQDIYGCSDSINVGVNEPNKVVITITNIDSAFCYGYADGSITTTTTGGSKGYKYQWNDALKQTTPKSNKLTKGTYKIIVKDIYGCSDSAIGTVYEPAKIVPMIMSNRLTMEGMSHEMYADISPVKKYKYDWTPIEIFFGDLYGKERPLVQFSQPRMVRLDVTDYKGCKGFDTATMVVVRPIRKIIPTGFTPNADALNEGFGLPDIFEIESFEVFDRWGGMIFRGSSTTPRWDGRLNGEVLPAGIYTYTIQAKLKGTEQVVKHGGSVVLIK